MNYEEGFLENLEMGKPIGETSRTVPFCKLGCVGAFRQTLGISQHWEVQGSVACPHSQITKVQYL